MTLGQFGGLFCVYLMAVIFILTLTYQEFRRVRFNFNVLFSMLYLLTFYFGFPLTCMLVFQFGVEVVPVEYLLYAMLSATAFYGIYMQIIIKKSTIHGLNVMILFLYFMLL